MAYPAGKCSLMATRAFKFRSRAMHVIPKPPWPSGSPSKQILLLQDRPGTQNVRRESCLSCYMPAVRARAIPRWDAYNSCNRSALCFCFNSLVVPISLALGYPSKRSCRHCIAHVHRGRRRPLPYRPLSSRQCGIAPLPRSPQYPSSRKR